MSDRQLYAEPVSPWAVNESDLREQLAEAMRVAGSKHSTWTQRTRAEQDVKQLTRKLEAAAIDGERKVRHESRHVRVAAEAIASLAAQQRVGEGTRMAVSNWMPLETL